MGYKLKPNKAVSKRFKVTGTGKVVRRKAFSSHLRSGRSAKRKRQIGRPAIMCENLARNMRRLMGVHAKNPLKIAHERALDAKRKEQAAEATVATVATVTTVATDAK